MALLNILLYPHPLLHEVSEETDPSCEEVQRLVEDLTETMQAHAAVGIAAPQTGALKRIVVVNVPPERRGHGLLKLLNPTIVYRSGKRRGREGCLSIPWYRANVTRARRIRVRAQNPVGEEMEIDAQGYEAVALQHEIDHLEGILFLDRITDMKRDLLRRY